MKYFFYFLALQIMFLAPSYTWAYKISGFQRLDSQKLLKVAPRLGLVSTKEETKIKKELIKLRQKNPEKFNEEKSKGLENSSLYQSSLLEVDYGLAKVEKAKAIAKVILYQKFEENWKDLKNTAVNTVAEKNFNKYKPRLVADLNRMVYLRQDQGYKFEVAQWGYITIAPNYTAATWSIEFASKYDGNKLEPGAEEIEIQESNKNTLDDSGEKSF